MVGVLVLAFAFLVGCGGFTGSTVGHVWVDESRSLLSFEVGNCTADTRIDEVVEGPDVIVVRMSVKTKNNDDCGGKIVVIDLEEPLGERVVVNAVTGVILQQLGPGAAAHGASD